MVAVAVVAAAAAAPPPPPSYDGDRRTRNLFFLRNPVDEAAELKKESSCCQEFNKKDWSLMGLSV